MSDLAFNQVLNKLKKLVPAKERLIIGTSGGIDSQVLAHIASKSKQNYDITCVYVSHGVRSNDEENLDIDVIKQLDLPFTRVDGGNRGPLDEHSARKLRYRCLSEIALQLGSKYVAVAHHADDQFETMLMSICRGISGFKPMAERRPISIESSYNHIQLIRPCMGVTKKDMLAIAKDRQLPWHDDITNESRQYTRNRIRKDVVPILKELYPRCAEHVAAI